MPMTIEEVTVDGFVFESLVVAEKSKTWTLCSHRPKGRLYSVSDWDGGRTAYEVYYWTRNRTSVVVGTWASLEDALSAAVSHARSSN